MSKFFKILVISAVITIVSAACSNSSNANGGRTEYEGDGTEEFVTVGNSSEPNKGGDYDDAEAAAGEADAPNEESGEEDDAEREIVESDIYKLEGDILWLANQYKGLIAVDISDPENLKILGTLKFKGYVGEMYIQKNRAYILVSHTNEKYDSGRIYYYNRTYSKLMVVDISDPENLSLVNEFELDGWIADSRQVGDVIYVASTEYAYSWSDCDGGSGTSGMNQISIASINIKDPQNIKLVDLETLEGVSYTFYVSQNHIYVAEADTYYWTENYKEGYPVTMFDISDPEGNIVKKAEFRTDGFMSDRWKMHEDGNVFFAVSSSDSWGNGDSMIESFNISYPENIEELDKLVFMSRQRLYGTKFEGDRMYAVTYFQQDPLHVIDISDPAELKELGQLEVPGWSDFIEVRGTKLLTVGREESNSKISLYDVADPKNPKEINTVKIGSNYSYSEANYDWKAFKIFDALGIILFPVTDYSDNWQTLYKLYLVDFDLEKGLLKTRGFIKSSSYIRRGIAVKDEKQERELVFSIGENHLVSADATDRDEPKILSELTLAEFVYEIDKCGKFLCSINDSKLTTYDSKTGKKLWESKQLKGYNDYYTMTMLKNSRYAYIFDKSGYYWWGDVEAVNDEGGETDGPKVKIVKFTDDGKFEEIGDFPFTSSISYYNVPAVSENNVLAMHRVEYREYSDEDNDYYTREQKMIFFDMNNPADGIKETALDFDYETLSYERNVFVSGNTFWTSGCKLKKKDKAGNQYFCYAVPFDVSDQTKPKEGTKINIPGELVGISDDGKYFYTKTPRKYEYEECAGEDDSCWNDEENYDFYILKLNSGKTAVSIVKKIQMTDSYKYEDGKSEYVSDYFGIRNNKVFLIRSISGTDWNICDYREDEHFDVTLVSAETGKDIASEYFNDVVNYGFVKEGGLLVNTGEGLNYIDENGKSKQVPDNIEMTTESVADSLVFDGKIYISAGWDGIRSFEIK